MRLLRYFLGVWWAAVTALPRRWLRGPGHPSWSWRAELAASVFRAAVLPVAGVPVARLRSGMPSANRPSALRRRVAHHRRVLAGRPAEVHTPRGWTADRPTVLYLHGGGYIVGSPGTHRELISRLAWSAGARCVALDYRLAPEAPFPAALDDALAAITALEADQVTPELLWLAGDSAGGGLTLATLLALRDTRRPQPAGALLLSPWVDLTDAGLSPDLDNPHDYLSADLLRVCSGHYASNTPRDDPRVSPVLADLTGLPPLCIQAGGAEIFLPQVTRFADRARAAGVEVVFEVGEGMIHVFQALAMFLPEARASLRSMGGFVRDRSSVRVEPESGSELVEVQPQAGQA